MKYLLTLEGRYDRMVGILTDDLLNQIKDSRQDWEKNPVNQEEHVLYHIADYTGTLKKVMLYLKIRRHRNLNYRDNFELLGTAFTRDKSDNEFGINIEDILSFWEDGENIEEDGAIIIQIAINPDTEPQLYHKLLPELMDTVRHEIEHLTQAGQNKMKGKAKISKLSNKISFEDGNPHYYYLMSHEIPALVNGLYKRAKWEKKPLDVVFNNFLDWLKDYGVYEEQYKKDLLFKKWKEFAIKHLPNAKWSN